MTILSVSGVKTCQVSAVKVLKVNLVTGQVRLASHDQMKDIKARMKKAIKATLHSTTQTLFRCSNVYKIIEERRVPFSSFFKKNFTLACMQLTLSYVL